MLIQWSPDLSVGNKKIDQEHQRWIEILNGFYEGLKSGEPKERLHELILEMLNYTRYHFKSEEEYMTSVSYPGLGEHKAIHQKYVDKISVFYEKITSGKMILSIEVTNFLKSWLIDHIKGVDQQYADFVEKQ